MFSKLYEIERVHITIAGLADRQLFYKYNFFSNVNYETFCFLKFQVTHDILLDCKMYKNFERHSTGKKFQY